MKEAGPRWLLVLIAGIVVGFAAAMYICFALTPAPADAQGVGIFSTSATGTRTNCSQLTSSVAGQTWCYDALTHQIMVFDGASFSTVSINNAIPFTRSIGGQANAINDYVYYLATGTQQQVGMFLEMAGKNTLAPGLFRIPFGVKIQTGGEGGTADGLIGLNIIAQQNAVDSVAFVNGIELSFNNLKRNDPLNPVDQNHFGLTLDAYGGFTTGPAAFAVRSGAANSTWQRGIFITASSINANGYAFDYAGNNTDGAVRITNDASIQVASGVSFNATQVLFNGSSRASVPRCTNNCGTSPTVVGTNTAMRVTMGSTGTPRSPFLVLFNGSWNATPSCIAQLTTSTTTTVSVTNATATGITVNTLVGPAQGDVYAIHCLGVG